MFYSIRLVDEMPHCLEMSLLIFCLDFLGLIGWVCFGDMMVHWLGINSLIIFSGSSLVGDLVELQLWGYDGS